jgi:methylenetetrahydrofolate dehydrogenase (NADP+)/methenyltetrahydrofolate cyclohydrolase
MTIIDGRKIAAEVMERLKTRPRPEKFLAAVLVGKAPASISFLKQKEKTARELCVDFRLYKFPADISKDELRGEVGKIAAHKSCGGVLVQLPLPDREAEQYVLNAIPPAKDVDVLGERALGAFYAGRNPVLPPAAGVVEEIVANCGLRMADCSVAVIGAGKLVGKPIAVWLLRKAKEVLVLYRGGDLDLLKGADVVISGVGVPGLINPDMPKPGACVIDFGYGEVNGKLSGDLCIPQSASQFNYTPTPGGTGPILVAKLLENFYKLTS